MTKAPCLYRFDELKDWSTQALIGDKWVAARPLGLDTIPNRLRLAWMVFTGKADALIWPRGQ